MKTNRLRRCALSFGVLLALGVGSVQADRTIGYTYTAEGLIETIDGPRTDVADVTTYGYDSQGNRTSITNALGHVTQITAHDVSGRPLTTVDPNGLISQFAYDPRGRLITRTVGGLATTFGYDQAGNITSVTLPDDSTINYTYDAAYRLIAIADGQGNRIDYTLNELGNRVLEEVRDPTGLLVRTQSRIFDELGRLIIAIGATGQQTGYNYDPNGNTLFVIDANDNLVKDQTFDALNRLTQVIDGAFGTTTYGYDTGDRLTAVTDPNGNMTTYTYDGLGNLLSQLSPDSGTTAFTYDEAGNRLSQTDARGITTTYDYDALNRPTAIHYADSTLDVTYTYDQGAHGVGRLTAVTDGSGTTNYAYDIRGNINAVATIRDGVTYTFHYGYDSAERLASITYPSGRRIDYIRSSTGLITEVRLDEFGTVTTLASDAHNIPFGALAELTFGNGLTLARNYDLDYRLTDQTTTTVQNLTFGFDPVGNITAVTDLVDIGRSQSFEYDSLNRLDIAQGDYGFRDFDYDANDNRIQVFDGSANTSYGYSSTSNWLLSTDDGNEDLTYSYDDSGNVISKLATDGGGWLYGYSAAGRLESVTLRVMVPSTKGKKPPKAEDTLVATYEYNVLGQRVLKSTVTGATTYLYGLDGSLLAEVDAQGTEWIEYIYLDGLPIAMLVTTAASTEPPISEEVIVDNGDSGTTSVGTWNTLSSNKDFGADHLRADGGTGSTYAWTPTLGGGDYEVYAWWASRKNYSNTVTYLLDHSGQQSLIVADHSSNGNQWNLLGTFAFTGDGTESIQVSDTNGKTIADAVRFNRILTSPPQQTITSAYFIHFDQLATPRLLTDVSGDVVWSISTWPFGLGSADDDVDGDGIPITMNLRFPGQYFDQETGLHYNYYRTYDPATGRYLESDPIGLVAGLNTYSYVSNMPTMHSDPFGLIRWEGDFEIAGLSAGVGASRVVFNLESECVGGKKAIIDDWSFWGFTTDIGLPPGGGVRGDVRLEDRLPSTNPDNLNHQNLEGDFSATSIGPTVGLGLPTAIDLGKATGLGSGKGLDIGVISITTAGDLKIPRHKVRYVDCECAQ